MGPRRTSNAAARGKIVHGEVYWDNSSSFVAWTNDDSPERTFTHEQGGLEQAKREVVKMLKKKARYDMRIASGILKALDRITEPKP